MFWSCAFLNLVLTDREGFFEAPEIWYKLWRKIPQDDSIHDFKAKRIRKSSSFWRKGQAFHLECFIKKGTQKWRVILLLYLAMFSFGLCFWQSMWRPWRRSSEDQQKWCKEWGPAPERGLSGIRTVWLGEGKTKGWFNGLQVFERSLYGRCRTDVLYFHRRPNKRKYF